MQHMRKGRSVRLVRQPLQRRPHGRANFGADGIGNGLPFGVVLEIDGPLRQSVEPTAQSRRVDVIQAQRMGKGQRRDRFEIVGHQFGRTLPGQFIQNGVGDVAHEIAGIAGDGAWTIFGIDAGPQIPMDLSVGGENGRLAEGAFDRRGADDIGEDVGGLADRLHIFPARDEPEIDRRHEGNRLAAAQFRIDRIRIGFERLDGYAVCIGHDVPLE
ncbi:hypothetical protein ACHMW9_10535 [Mesorhizobium terrae]